MANVRRLNSLRYPRVYVPLTLLLFMIILGIILGRISPFYSHIVLMIFFYAGLAGAWNIIGGFAGQLSLGHAAFYGIGAYTSTLLYINAGLSPWLGMIAAGMAAAVVGLGLGSVSLRLKGPFFSMITIAFAEVIKIVVVNTPSITKGSVGILIPFRPSFSHMIFRDKFSYLFLALGFMLLVFLLSLWIERSRLGYYLLAVRENESAAQALTINTSWYKIIAMALSAFLMAIGGVIYTQYILFIEPASEFDFVTSINPALIAMIGGMGTAIGPIIGSIIMTPLQELLRSWLGGVAQGLHLFVYGVILVAVVIFVPGGFVGLLSKTYHRVLSKLPVLGGTQPGEINPVKQGSGMKG